MRLTRMRRSLSALLWAPAILFGALLLAESALRAVYTLAGWRAEAAPLIYERVYWATPPWVHHQSILYEDPELGRWMRPNASRTYVNLFGPIEVTYAFTNGGRAGAWIGLENYRPRVFALRAQDVGTTVYLPVAQFGSQTLRSDASHPDAEGYARIAAALLQTLRETASFRSYLGRRGDPPPVEGD